MTSFQIAKDHFKKTNKALLVQVRGKDYILHKDYFEAWELAVQDGDNEMRVIPLYILNPNKGEKLGYRWVRIKNIVFDRDWETK